MQKALFENRIYSDSRSEVAFTILNVSSVFEQLVHYEELLAGPYTFVKNAASYQIDPLGLVTCDTSCSRITVESSFSKEFEATKNISFDVFVFRSIEKETCGIQCDKCKCGTFQKQTITYGGGYGWSYTFHPFAAFPLVEVPISISGSVRGSETSTYNSCTGSSDSFGCWTAGFTISAAGCAGNKWVLQACFGCSGSFSQSTCPEGDNGFHGECGITICTLGACHFTRLIGTN